jgi:hypothetical protein
MRKSPEELYAILARTGSLGHDAGSQTRIGDDLSALDRGLTGSPGENHPKLRRGPK